MRFSNGKSDEEQPIVSNQGGMKIIEIKKGGDEINRNTSKVIKK